MNISNHDRAAGGSSHGEPTAARLTHLVGTTGTLRSSSLFPDDLGEALGEHARSSSSAARTPTQDSAANDSLSVRLVGETMTPCGSPGVRAFAVSLLNGRGEATPERVFSFYVVLERTAAIIPYCIGELGVSVWAQQQEYPAMAARDIFVNSPGPKESGILPSAISLPDESFLAQGSRDRLKSSIAKDIGLVEQEAPLRLSHAGPPSAGTGTQLVTLWGLGVAATPTIQRGASQKSGHGSFIPASSVIDAYLRGEIRDLRLVVGTLALCHRLGVPLSIELPLTKNGPGLAPPPGVHMPETSEELRAIISAPPKDPSALASVSVRETTMGASQFLQAHEVEVTRVKDARGQESYRTQICTRKGFDAVDIVAYHFVDDKVRLLAKRGIRPANAVRRLLSEGHSNDGGASLTLESVAESLEGETTMEGIARRAAAGVAEELGMGVLSTPVIIGMSSPCPERNIERVYEALVEVDPHVSVEAEHSIEERVDIFSLRPQDVITLFESGDLRDLRLALQAYLLLAATRGTSET